MGRNNNKKSPAGNAGQRRASSIHERLPDKPTSTGMPVLGSIDHNSNSSSERRFRLKTFFSKAMESLNSYDASPTPFVKNFLSVGEAACRLIHTCQLN